MRSIGASKAWTCQELKGEIVTEMILTLPHLPPQKLDATLELLRHPIAVDLDGTFIRSDSLYETLFDVARINPLSIFIAIAVFMFRGRAAMKAFLARRSPLNVSLWPVRSDLFVYLQEHVRGGGEVILATAANHRVAAAVQKAYPLFSQAIGSSDDRNLKGAAKAELLRERFSEGFIYAGDSRADAPVWAAAKGAVLAGNIGAIRPIAASKAPIVAEFPETDAQGVIELVRALRFHQWVKNVLIFVPLLLVGRAFDPAAWITVMIGFLALGLLASGTYVLNDLWDLQHDRAHWSKRKRAFASGALPLHFGAAIAFFLICMGLIVTSFLGVAALMVLILYLVCTLSYSFFLKAIPVLDVTVIASLFSLRLFFGSVLINAWASHWLMVFSMFVFFSLAFAKRYVELLRFDEQANVKVAGRGYIKGDMPLVMSMGISAMFCAIVVVVLYLIEDAFVKGVYAQPQILWVVPYLLFLFLSRIWLCAQRGTLNDDPIVFAMKDPVALSIGAALALTYAIAMVPIAK